MNKFIETMAVALITFLTVIIAFGVAAATYPNI